MGYLVACTRYMDSLATDKVVTTRSSEGRSNSDRRILLDNKKYATAYSPTPSGYGRPHFRHRHLIEGSEIILARPDIAPGIGQAGDPAVRLVMVAVTVRPNGISDDKSVGIAKHPARKGGPVAAQWLTMAEHAATALPLGERLKQLRRDRGWSQADLATKVGADAGQISRYENGHMTPSAEAVAKLAEILDVSCDYLLIESSPRRPLHAPENALGDRLAVVAELSNEEIGVLRSAIDGLVAKSRLRTLASGVT